MKERRREEQPKPLPFTLQTFRVGALLLGEGNGYDEVKTSQQVHVEEATGWGCLTSTCLAPPDQMCASS
jgi:hypothetical protein